MMGKYSRIERERKFLISRDSVVLDVLPLKLILDNYIVNSTLRLRKMSDQSETIYKFTKKIQTDIFGQCVITNIYLSESEYNMFQNLDSWQLTKTRYYYRTEYLTIAIDDFNEDNLLAEIEFHNDQEMNDFIMPIPFIEEVTNQLCFTGWELSQKYGKRSTAIFAV